MKIVPPTAEGLALAAEAIRAGKVVAYPTDTVYGLGADPFSESAVRRLFEIKGRDEGKLVLLVVADEPQLREVVASVPRVAAIYMQAFWPGPLSLLFPKSYRMPPAVTAGSNNVCVRCPACRVARALCRAVGTAVTSSLANLSGGVPARSLGELNLPGVAVGIDAGTLAVLEVSTVFDPTHGTVLRKGAVSDAELRAVLEW